MSSAVYKPKKKNKKNVFLKLIIERTRRWSDLYIGPCKCLYTNTQQLRYHSPEHTITITCISILHCLCYLHCLYCLCCLHRFSGIIYFLNVWMSGLTFSSSYGWGVEWQFPVFAINRASSALACCFGGYRTVHLYIGTETTYREIWRPRWRQYKQWGMSVRHSYVKWLIIVQTSISGL